jgi:2-methylisocitrate lyase-like PEP mutase family enzyme
MSSEAKTFHDLHQGTDLLILPNAWDAGSARLFEDAGAKAIATTSAGVAWALGYQDGNMLPIDKLVAVVSGISDIIKVPLSVDFEGGYTHDPKKIGETLKPILGAGAVGINIEDGDDAPELLARKIEQARKTAQAAGVELFINARTDVYLNEVGEPESRAQETISRATSYREAGANGIFVPGLFETAAIKGIASEVRIPLNVMAWPDLPSAATLSNLGVRRLSAGGSILQLIWYQAAKVAKQFLQTGDARSVAGEALGYSKLQDLFSR